MNRKKSERASLENKKGMFVQIGLVVALSIVIFAFEYKTYDKKETEIIVREALTEVEETIIQTQREDTPPPPEDTPPPETTEFDIVEDDVEIEQEFNITSLEGTTNVAATVKQIVIEEEEEEVVEEAPIFRVVEQEASFPGGPAKLFQYLADNIKYPQQAKETGTQGRVYLEFVVEVDGSITDIKILRDIGSGCGEEAKRVVESMPRWQPAMQRGKAVRQYFNLPVNFTLKG